MHEIFPNLILARHFNTGDPEKLCVTQNPFLSGSLHVDWQEFMLILKVEQVR